MVRPPRDRAEATFHPISEAFFRLRVQRRRSGYTRRPLHLNVPEKRSAPRKLLHALAIAEYPQAWLKALSRIKRKRRC